MPKVKLEFLQEGMEVEADVKNMDDMLLIPAGCELTARHIKVLNAWGITEICVKVTGEMEDGNDPLKKLSAEELETLTRKVRGRFFQLEDGVAIHQTMLKTMLTRQAKAILARRCGQLTAQTQRAL